jgi:hypothetical protein
MKAVLCLSLALGVPVSAFAGIYEELREINANYPAQIDRGEQIMLTQGAQGPWPKAWVFRTIDATPEEVAAVFFDAATHKDYFPNVYRSEVVAQPNPTTVEVEYALSVPVVSDEVYTVRDVLTSYNEGKAFKVEWTKLRATSSRHIEGYLLMEEHQGKTIIEYYNYVIPGSGVSGLPFIRNKAMAQLNQTVAALAKEVERRKAEQGDRLQELVRGIRQALGLTQ